MFNSILPSSEDLSLSPPPGWAQGFVTTVCILSILLPPGLLRVSSGAIIFGFMFYLLFRTAEQSDDAYIVSTTCICLLYRWVDLVVIHKPEQDFWRVGDGKAKEAKIEGRAPSGLWEKLKWTFELWNNQRGIGWNFQSNSLPPALPKDYPKILFLKSSFLRFIRMYIGLDIVQNILKHTYALYPIPFFSIPLPTQVFLAWVTAFKAYYGLEMIYSLGALTVVLGICTPADWPPMSGAFRRDAWSVRKMWGSCWHQMMRRPCGEGGRIVRDLFRFKKGGFLSRYSQVWVAFLVSAMSHHVGAVVGLFEDGGFWQAVYFMVQPVGFMVEDLVMFVGRKAGIEESVWTKRLGFLWVFLWFSCWIPTMIAYQPRSWVENLAIPSIIEYIVKFMS